MNFRDFAIVRKMLRVRSHRSINRQKKKLIDQRQLKNITSKDHNYARHITG